jgi:hypothetical protein
VLEGGCPGVKARFGVWRLWEIGRSTLFLTARRTTMARAQHTSIRRVVVALVALGAGVASTTPSVAGADPPGQACQDGNWFTIEYTAHYAGATGEADGDYVRRIPTTGGCASSWAHGDGQLSTAAIAAQCRTGIEERFGPYPIVVRFADTFVLNNRADCIRIFTGVAHGEIDPGPAPLFPGGA